MARELVSILENKRKNYLINGNFDFWQRGTSVSSSGNIYTADRWRIDNTQTNTSSRQTIGAPVGSQFYYRLQFGLNGACQMFQALESTMLRELKGKTCTFSCLLRRDSNFTGNLELRIQKNTTADTSIGGSWNIFESLVIPSSSIPLRVPSSTDWVRFSVTFTIPNDGTAEGFRVNFTTLSLQPSGATLEIAQPMLNLGSTAAPFSLFGDDYRGELAACQRYYEKSYALDSAPGAAVSSGAWFGYPTDIGSTTDRFGLSIQFSTRKRVAPAMSYFNWRGDFAQNKVSQYNADTNNPHNAGSGTATESEMGVGGYLDCTNNLATGSLAGTHWVADAEL